MTLIAPLIQHSLSSPVCDVFMSFYYFLAKPSSELDTSITVTRMIPNALGSKIQNQQFGLAIYVLDREIKKWCPWKILAPTESLHWTVSSVEIGLRVGEIAVALPVTSDFVSDNYERLPSPILRGIDGSPVATRCSLRFHWRGASSSYQAEYPTAMTKQVQGQVTSFNLNSRHQGTNAVTFLCAVNITQDASLDLGSYAIKSLKRGGDSSNQPSEMAERNSCHVVSMSPEQAAECLGFTSSEAVFLPIYITMCAVEGRNEISVEHTHPPHEMFWKSRAQRFCLPRLRASWIGREE